MPPELADTLSREDVAAILAGPPEDAVAWLRDQAERGVVEAQALYGQVLLDGRGVAPDHAAAFDWFLKAAHTGHAMACNMVGRCYENGRGRQASPRAAADWYRRAAGLGLDWGMYNLANLLTLGSGVTEAKAEALALYRQAAALGHAKSLNIIGGFYEDGWVVEKDLDRARDYYRRASESGDFRGHFNLGRCLVAEGHVDSARALFRCARQGSPDAFVAKMMAWLEERHLTLDDAP